MGKECNRMSARGNAIIGFIVAGGALVALAGVAPGPAIGIAAVIGLGVALTHPDEITNMINLFTSSLKPL